MTTAAPTDHLLALAAAGDRAAFEAFVDHTAPAVWSLVRRLTSDAATAEDAMQETYTAAWRGAEGWRNEGSAQAWLLGLARRQAARTWRRRAGQPIEHASLTELALAAGWGDDPEVLTARSEDRAQVLDALGTLSPADRQVITRCDLEGLSPTALGEMLGVAAGTIRVRRHRARLRLLAALRTEDGHG